MMLEPTHSFTWWKFKKRNPFKLNLQIVRALNFVNNKKITHEIQKGIYQFIDEKNICHKVIPLMLAKLVVIRVVVLKDRVVHIYWQ